MAFDYDLFVIGAGSGGVRAARLAADTGARVAIAEERRYGGTCVIRGCIPKKILLYAAQFAQEFRDAVGYGWSVKQPQFDWPTLIAAKDAEISRLEHLYRNTLATAGVKMFDMRANLLDCHRVRLADGRQLAAKYILLATGGRPYVPNIIGAEYGITSDHIFDLKQQPQRVLIIGGGYIACELASILHGLGSKVSQYYRGRQILRGFDNQIRDFTANQILEKGIDLHVNSDICVIKKNTNGLVVVNRHGEKAQFDAVLFATGRIANTAAMGLKSVGVRLGRRGAVVVDIYSQSSIPSIFAVGDVTNRMSLTPVAIREGAAFVQSVFNGDPTGVNYDAIPTAIFTQPEIGTVGLSQEAAALCEDIEVYSTVFRPLKHIVAANSEKILMKIIVSAQSRRVLGVHIVGAGASEMIQLVSIAVKMQATKEQFDATIAVHPTAAEELVTMKKAQFKIAKTQI